MLSSALFHEKLYNGSIAKRLGSLQRRAAIRVGGIDIDTQLH
jgi:hypothetical protein